jgi:hypothetical protein
MKNMNSDKYVNNFKGWSKAYLNQKIDIENKINLAGIEPTSFPFTFHSSTNVPLNKIFNMYSQILRTFNPNSLWWVHMGISLKERQITEEPMKVKIWKKLLIHKHLV